MPQPFGLRLHFPPYEVLIFGDSNHRFNSADNVHTYDHEYSAIPPEQRRPLDGMGYGVVVLEMETTIASALLCGDGWWTLLHQHSAVLHHDACVVVVGQNIFSLALPSLSLQWHMRDELGQCHEVLYSPSHNCLLVQGALDVLCLDLAGRLLWTTGGERRMMIADSFKLREDSVEVADDEGRVYLYDIATGRLLSGPHPSPSVEPVRGA